MVTRNGHYIETNVRMNKRFGVLSNPTPSQGPNWPKSALKVTLYAYFLKYHLRLMSLTIIYCLGHPCSDKQ